MNGNKIDRIASGNRISVVQQPHANLTSIILKCCFEVMNELGTGFLESVYRNALFIALQQRKLVVEIEKPLEVNFRGVKIGFYKADLILEGSVIIELKCCKSLLPEHQAQVINYLKATNIPVGLLVNFGNWRLDYKRLHHPSLHHAAGGDPVDLVNNVLPGF